MDRENKNTDDIAVTKERSTKKLEYRAPKLEVLGSVVELTAGYGGNASDVLVDMSMTMML